MSRPSTTSRRLQQPLYQRIAVDLDRQLWRFKPGDVFCSDREVAKRYKVSFLTARQAVKYLADQGKLKRIARRGTFVAGSGSPSRKRGGAVGIKTVRVIHYSPHDVSGIGPYYSSMLAMLQAEAMNDGHDLVFCAAGSRDSLELAARAMSERGEEGAIIIGPVGRDFCRTLLGIPGLRIVSIEHDYTDVGIDSVCWNTAEAGMRGVRFLTDRGCRRLFYVGEALDPAYTLPAEIAKAREWPDSLQLRMGCRSALRFCRGVLAINEEMMMQYDECGRVSYPRIPLVAEQAAGAVVFNRSIAKALLRQNGIKMSEELDFWKGQTGGPVAVGVNATGELLLAGYEKNPTLAAQAGMQIMRGKLMREGDCDGGTPVKTVLPLPETVVAPAVVAGDGHEHHT